MDREKIRKRASGRCEYCHAPERLAGYAFMIDHILPRGHGGGDQPRNLALSCWCCNAYKSDHLDGTDPVRGTTVRLFNPRRQKWDEHFQWSGDFTRIEGVTPTGRATVSRLKMNSHPDRSEARRLWHMAGYLP